MKKNPPPSPCRSLRPALLLVAAGLLLAPLPAAAAAYPRPALQPEDAIPLYAGLYIARIQKMGYRLDHSPQSVAEVERFLARELAGEKPSPGSMLSYDTPKVVLSLGHYLGEVILRQRPGIWKVDRAPGRRFWEWRYLMFKDGTVTNPILKVWDRYSRRESQALADYLAEVLAGKGDGSGSGRAAALQPAKAAPRTAIM